MGLSFNVSRPQGITSYDTLTNYIPINNHQLSLMSCHVQCDVVSKTHDDNLETSFLYPFHVGQLDIEKLLYVYNGK